MKKYELYYDDRGDPESPGWVLRMTDEDDSDDRDEWSLDVTDEDAVVEAQAEAVEIIGSAVDWTREDDPEVHAYVAEVDRMKTIIVSRHTGAIDWLRKYHPELCDDADVVSHASPDDLRGRRVVGTLPVHLAVYCGEYWHLEMNLPPEARGKELTAEDMEKYGCRITQYHVFRAGPIQLVTLHNDPVARVDLDDEEVE